LIDKTDVVINSLVASALASRKRKEKLIAENYLVAGPLLSTL
jgi:hypothetical protein